MGRAITVSEVPQSASNPNNMSFEQREKELKAQEKAEAEVRQREKNSPFKVWAQLNIEHAKELRSLAMKNPIAHGLLYFLVEQMDNYNAVMCSYKVLEEVLDVSSATITRNIKVLKDKKFIAVLKSGTSNVYTVNHNVFWKSWGNKQRYSKFPANVILSASEQEEQVKLQIEKHKEISLKEDE